MANGTDQYDLRDQKRKDVIKLDPRNMKTAMELTGMSPELMDQALRQAGAAYDVAFDYGPEEEFTEEDQRALDTLQGKVEKNQPIDVPAPISGLLPGNEYSVDFTGLSQGLQNLAGTLVNKEKADRLYGEPEKAKRLSSKAKERLAKAKELRQTAEAMQAAGREDVSEQMLRDAGELEKRAQRDQQAAEDAEGVLQKANRLEERKQRALDREDQREEFIRTFGQETYDQALQAEREGRKQQALTERERIRQKALTARNEADHKYGLTKARINAKAKLKGDKESTLGWPSYGQPEYVQEFIPEYMKYWTERESQLEDQVFSPTTGNPLPSATEEQKAEYEAIQQIKSLVRDIELDAITFKQFKEEGVTADQLPDTHYPSDRQRQQLLMMKQLGIPAELIEAYKFYNRISLNKAPQGPQGNTTGNDVSDVFRDQQAPGEGTVLKNE